MLRISAPGAFKTGRIQGFLRTFPRIRAGNAMFNTALSGVRFVSYFDPVLFSGRRESYISPAM